MVNVLDQGTHSTDRAATFLFYGWLFLFIGSPCLLLASIGFADILMEDRPKKGRIEHLFGRVEK